MVIPDGNVLGVAAVPAEGDAPLVVDADGVEAEEVALECFEAVAWWDGEVVEDDGFVELDQFPDGDA